MACWKHFLFKILLTLAISFTAWASSKDYRHSVHLSVDKSDDGRFRLDNLQRIANEMIASRRERRPSRLANENPYLEKPSCDQYAEFRTFDGTCNNLHQSWMGAAKTPLIWMSPHRYQDGYNEPRLMHHYTDSILPSPRRVSLNIHLTTSNTSTEHSHLLMNWGQFIAHDISLSPESSGEGGEKANKTQCCEADRNPHRECFPISASGDTIFRTNCIPFFRSAPIPGLPHQPIMRYQMNDVTSFIDGSMIYGSTQLRAKTLRSFKSGKLRSTFTRNEERLHDEADNPRDCFREGQKCRYASGDVRNSEQAALTSIHTLLLRCHNRIATLLQTLNGHWDDERLYQITRKIVGAIIQRITYKEFLPEVIGPRYMRRFDLELRENGQRFNRYYPNEDASIMTEFSTVAFRFGHTLIRQTFSHSGLSLDLKNVFDAYKTIERYGSNGMLRGVIADRMETCDRFFTRGVRDNLFGEDMDLPAFNIQRGRDHGIGSYNDIRRALGLHAHRDWNRMAGDSHSHTTVNDMKKVYPHAEDIEAYPGGVSEIPTPGGVVGETFAQIIGMQFKKMRYGDRFWHETSDQRIGFTDGQLAEIRKASLAMLFCEHVPNARVRQLLIKAEGPTSPAVDCKDIPKMNLDAWKDNTVPVPSASPTETAIPITRTPPRHQPKSRQFRSRPESNRYRSHPKFRFFQNRSVPRRFRNQSGYNRHQTPHGRFRH